MSTLADWQQRELDSAAISFLASKESYEQFSEILATLNSPQLLEAVESASQRMERRKESLIHLMNVHGVMVFTANYYGDDPKVITLLDGELIIESEVSKPHVDEIDEQLKDQDYPQLADLLSDLALSLYEDDGASYQTALPREVISHMGCKPRLQWAFRVLHQMSLKLNEVGDGTNDNF